MTRQGTLAYYLAAWVIGCFIVSLLVWVIAVASGQPPRAAMLLEMYFFALVFGAVDALLFAFLLRRIMRWWGTHALWPWLLSGAGVGFALIMLLAEANSAWINWNAPVTGPIHYFPRSAAGRSQRPAIRRLVASAHRRRGHGRGALPGRSRLQSRRGCSRRRSGAGRDARSRLNFPFGHKACSQFSAPVPIIDFAPLPIINLAPLPGTCRERDSRSLLAAIAARFHLSKIIIVDIYRHVRQRSVTGPCNGCTMGSPVRRDCNSAAFNS